MYKRQVYCDGRLLFERFCAGEAAGRVCALWAPEGADEAGRIRWDYGACAYSGAQQAPKAVSYTHLDVYKRQAVALPALLYTLGQAQAGAPLWWHMNSLLLGGAFAAMTL